MRAARGGGVWTGGMREECVKVAGREKEKVNNKFPYTHKTLCVTL